MHCFGIAKGGTELWANANRHPDVRRDEYVCATESFRGDANYGVRLAVDLKGAADKIIAAALAFPKSVARDYDRDVGVRFAFFGAIKPAAIGLDAHH